MIKKVQRKFLHQRPETNLVLKWIGSTPPPPPPPPSNDKTGWDFCVILLRNRQTAMTTCVSLQGELLEYKQRPRGTKLLFCLFRLSDEKRPFSKLHLEENWNECVLPRRWRIRSPQSLQSARLTTPGSTAVRRQPGTQRAGRGRRRSPLSEYQKSKWYRICPYIVLYCYTPFYWTYFIDALTWNQLFPVAADRRVADYLR